MSGFVQFITNAYALLATVPFVVFALVWLIVAAVTRDKKRARKFAMDVTMLLLIGAVASLWNQFFNSRFGFWLILLVILASVGLLGSYQNRSKGRVDLLKITRIVWRVGFLFLSLLYIVFLLINFSLYMIT